MPVPPIILGALKGYLADKALGAMGASPQVRTIGKTIADPRGVINEKIATAAMNKLMEKAYKDVKPIENSEDVEFDMVDEPTAPRPPLKPGVHTQSGFKKGGKVRKIDGCAQRGKTRGKYI